MKMRDLKTADIFKMSKILKKIDLKIDAEGKSATQLGADIILGIGENLHLAEKEINSFMGDLVGISAKEFSELPIADTCQIIEDFKKLEGLDSFFKLAGQSNKK